MNKYAKNKRGFAIPLVLLVITSLALVIIAYHMLVRGKALETRHIAYNLKALKFARAVASYAACQLRETVNKAADNESSQIVKELRDATSNCELSSAAVGELNCQDFLDKLVEETPIDSNTVIIAKVEGIKNIEELKISIQDIEDIPGVSKKDPKEKFGQLNIYVKIMVGHDKLNMFAVEEASTTLPFKVVSLYPYQQDISKFALYAKEATSNDFEGDGLSFVLNCAPGKIFLGTSASIELVSSAMEGFCDYTGGTPKYASNYIPGIGDSSISDTGIGFRTANWLYKDVNFNGQFGKIIPDVGNIRSRISNAKPSWIALFGENKESLAEIYTKGGDVSDLTVRISYLINNNNHQLMAAIMYNENGLPSTSNGNDFDLVYNPKTQSGYVERSYNDTIFFQNHNYLVARILEYSNGDLSSSKIREFLAANDFKNKIMSNIAKTSYIDYFKVKTNNNGFNHVGFADSGNDAELEMKNRVIFNISDLSQLGKYGNENRSVIKYDGTLPSNFDGTVLTTLGNVQGIAPANDGRYYVITTSNSVNVDGIDGCYVVALNGTVTGGSINGGIACGRLTKSTGQLVYDSKYSQPPQDGLCVAVGPEGKKP